MEKIRRMDVDLREVLTCWLNFIVKGRETDRGETE